MSFNTIRISDGNDKIVGVTGKALNVALGDSASIDAFGRMRVSDPQTLFDYSGEYDAGLLLWEHQTAGNGQATHVAATSSVAMTTTTASGDKVIRQTRQYHRYQPGKSQLVLLTFVMSAAKDGLRQRVGYFDGSDGIFLQLDGETLSVVRRSSASGTPVDTVIERSSWNISPLQSLDISKAQIFYIDMEWLGVGRVRCGFVIDGTFVPVHQFLHANIISSVYMRTACLPVRYAIENTSLLLSGANVLSAICASVISEGGFETGRGYAFSAGSSFTTLKALANDTRTPILSLRPKATFNSVVNRGTIIPATVKGYAASAGALLEVVYNGSLTDASFGSAGDNSISETDTAATAITGGIVVASVPVPAAAQGALVAPGAQALGMLSRLPLTLDIDGANPIPITICATRIGGSGTSNVAASIEWQEIR